MRKNPHDFALSADHRFAYVPIYGPGVYGRNPDPEHEIYVLDLGTRKVAKVIDLLPYRSPHGIQIDERGLLYEKLKVVPYCPRCGTALSSHELGQPDVYRDVIDPSVYVRFPVTETHGAVQATRQVPGPSFPFIVYAVRRFIASRRPFRCPDCNAPVDHA